MGSCVSHFNVSLIVWAKSQTVSIWFESLGHSTYILGRWLTYRLHATRVTCRRLRPWLCPLPKAGSVTSINSLPCLIIDVLLLIGSPLGSALQPLPSQSHWLARPLALVVLNWINWLHFLVNWCWSRVSEKVAVRWDSKFLNLCLKYDFNWRCFAEAWRPWNAVCIMYLIKLSVLAIHVETDVAYRRILTSTDPVLCNDFN